MFSSNKIRRISQKRIIVLVTWLIVVLLCGLMLQTAAEAKSEADVQEQLVADGAILMDAASGAILFEKNADQQMNPASTTKIMTALLALENCSLDEIVTASSNAVGIESSALNLQEGEQLTMKDALYALLLYSANDVAIAIAEHVAGSVPAFCTLMNQKAAELGAQQTHYVSPHGLTAPEHYTTPRDLLLITKAAMQNSIFREFVDTRSQQITRIDSEGNISTMQLTNSNQLLGSYSGLIGVKTGYTQAAGNCLVSAAVREGREIYAVVLHSDAESVWNDSKLLLNYGFNNFKNINLVVAGTDMKYVRAQDGTARKIALLAADDLTITVAKKDTTDYSEAAVQLVFDSEVKTPVAAGQILGKADYYLNDSIIGEVAVASAAEMTAARVYQKVWFKIAAGILLLFLLLLNVRRRKSRKNRKIKLVRKQNDTLKI